MKRFTEFLEEQEDQNAVDAAKYTDVPPNKIKNYQEKACDVFKAIFNRNPVESFQFLEKFGSNEDKELINSIKYEMDQDAKNPVQNGLGYASPN